jgi:hypothetical protein
MNEDISASDNLSQETKSKTTIRVVHNRENPYVMINKSALRHPSLSLKARGLWAYLLSFPDDWEFKVSHLISSLPEGKVAIYGAFDELIEHGFLIRVQYTGSKEHGTVGFQKLQYIVFEYPLTTEERQQKYAEFQKNCIHSGKVKINSVQSGFVEARNELTQDVPLLSNDSTLLNNERERESARAPDPSPPIKKPEPPPTLHGQYVKLKAGEYDELCKTIGKGLVGHYIAKINNHVPNSKNGPYKDYGALIRKWYYDDRLNNKLPKVSQAVKQNGDITQEDITAHRKARIKAIMGANREKIAEKELYFDDRVTHVRIGNDSLNYDDPKYPLLLKHYLDKHGISI